MNLFRSAQIAPALRVTQRAIRDPGFGTRETILKTSGKGESQWHQCRAYGAMLHASSRRRWILPKRGPFPRNESSDLSRLDAPSSAVNRMVPTFPTIGGEKHSVFGQCSSAFCDRFSAYDAAYVVLPEPAEATVVPCSATRSIPRDCRVVARPVLLGGLPRFSVDPRPTH